LENSKTLIENKLIFGKLSILPCKTSFPLGNSLPLLRKLASAWETAYLSLENWLLGKLSTLLGKLASPWEILYPP
jgi:hypothetical protein